MGNISVLNSTAVWYSRCLSHSKVRNEMPGERYSLAKMPQFHVYATTIYEVVASNIIESTENTNYSDLAAVSVITPYAGNPFSEASFKLEARADKQLDSGVDCRRSNYSYYLKNVIIYIVSATLQYSRCQWYVKLVD